MQNHSRSKDASLTFKSCKNRSIETKQQSIARSTLKTSKHIHSNAKHQKQKNLKSKKSTAIKSIGKLDLLAGKIARKLESFEKQQAIVTVSTTTNARSESDSNNFDKLGYRDLRFNKSTNILYEKIIQDQSCMELRKSQGQLSYDLLHQQQQNYQKVFNQALSRPNCLKNIKVKRKNIVNKYSREHILLQQVKRYKKQQNQNWRCINKELIKFLSKQKDQIQPQEQKLIKERLLKQGQANYRWLQIQDKMPIEEYQLINVNPRNKKFIKATKNQRSPFIQSNDQPISMKMLLKNQCWQKYLWDDEASQKSELQCDQKENSDHEYMSTHFKAQDILDEANYVQENVDLILNWLMDQFVVELSDRLNFNKIAADFAKKDEKDQSQRKKHNSNEEFLNFLHSVNQTNEDCQQVYDLCGGLKDKSPLYIRHAFKELQETNPSLNKVQIRDKLLKLISNRQLEASQLFPYQQNEQQEWIKISFLYELEEVIWQGLVIEETCHLWMGGMV